MEKKLDTRKIILYSICIIAGVNLIDALPCLLSKPSFIATKSIFIIIGEIIFTILALSAYFFIADKVSGNKKVGCIDVIVLVVMIVAYNLAISIINGINEVSPLMFIIKVMVIGYFAFKEVKFNMEEMFSKQ